MCRSGLIRARYSACGEISLHDTYVVDSIYAVFVVPYLNSDPT